MKQHVEQLLQQALSALKTVESPLDNVTVAVERTRDLSHGHSASNLAMQLAKPLQELL